MAPGKGRTKACETLRLQPHTNAAKAKTRMMAFLLEDLFLCGVGCARKREREAMSASAARTQDLTYTIVVTSPLPPARL